MRLSIITFKVDFFLRMGAIEIHAIIIAKGNVDIKPKYLKPIAPINPPIKNEHTSER